ncbi:MAG TPA: hypothetical protein VMV45_10605 [Casimicrobiaceae bacterium]|nr:hypothetical protein [Casimicrobiaceae bacterium]
MMQWTIAYGTLSVGMARTGVARVAALLILAWLASSALAQTPYQNCTIVDDQCAFVLPPGCSCQKKSDLTAPPPLPAPPGCDPDEIKKQISTLVGTLKFLAAPPTCQITQEQCESIPSRQVAQSSDGSLVCAPVSCSKTCYSFGGVPICSTCLSLPISPKTSYDPNDKEGTRGVSTSQFVRADQPLTYTIHFENLATATAPAQVIAITDRLDAATVDFDTFRLGPVVFGDSTLAPAPGIKLWTGGIDLRPRQNILVTVAAGLDPATGVVTWRFMSIDPETGQLTDDPDAGLLPPNVSPPAGEGSVTFTVMPRTGVATGTVIRNQASIVFDVNPAIATPTWANTIDKDPPITHVLPLAATQASTSFNVQWTGSDAGSGTSSYAILVSDNGAPFQVWLDSTPTSSAMYGGQPGHTYRFFSVGIDQAGNVEALKSVADASTTVASVSSCASNVTSSLQVTRSGFSYNLATGRFIQTVTLKNISSATITGPISFVLDNLSSNATLYIPSGTTSCATPSGSPYVNLAANLAPGGSATVAMQFVNPTRTGITYLARVLAGAAGR